jgi:4-hydroxybenzoate polyprenyltransferase
LLGFSKRRHELVRLGQEARVHRQVLGEYNSRFLDMMIGIVTASTVMSYALYTVSEETVQRFHTRGLLLTLPFVLYGICRYLYLVYHKDQGDDPTQSLLTDRPMVINLCLWALTTVVVLYR